MNVIVASETSINVLLFDQCAFIYLYDKNTNKSYFLSSITHTYLHACSFPGANICLSKFFAKMSGTFYQYGIFQVNPVFFIPVIICEECHIYLADYIRRRLLYWHLIAKARLWQCQQNEYYHQNNFFRLHLYYWYN